MCRKKADLYYGFDVQIKVSHNFQENEILNEIHKMQFSLLWMITFLYMFYMVKVLHKIYLPKCIILYN